MLSEKSAEHPLGETEKLHRCRRGHGRGPRSAVEEGDLSEEVAGLEERLLLSADRDLRVAVEDQEQADAAIALTGEDGVLLVVHVLGGLRDQADLPLRAAGEQRYGRELLGDLLDG